MEEKEEGTEYATETMIKTVYGNNDLLNSGPGYSNGKAHSVSTVILITVTPVHIKCLRLCLRTLPS